MPTTLTTPHATSAASAAEEGVAFPEIDGARPTTPTNRSIYADAAAPVDPPLAERIRATRDWRKEYLTHVRALTAASGADARASLAIAEAGLASMHRRLVVDRDGRALSLSDAVAAGGRDRDRLGLGRIEGTGRRESELSVPYRGSPLRGAALLAQLDRWVAGGIVEPSFAAAIRRVVEHPEWLALPGRRVALVGAGAEMSPLEPLSRWGADVVALDVPQPAVWERIGTVARGGAGPLTFPAAPDGRPGLDLLRALPEARAFLEAASPGQDLVLGMYAYADGGTHVRLSAAFDALAGHFLADRPRTALAYLATPTDAFVVPDEVVADARARYAGRGVGRVLQTPVRRAARGALFAPAYTDGGRVADVLVEQQGPNYALAKRLQRWRGVLAERERRTVSFNVAPAAMTRSVTKNRVLAAAYRGAGRFGVEIFAPATCRALMAALLVHDVHRSRPPRRHPEELFSEAAAHGGLWRAPYEPRSVLGLAALLGLAGLGRR